MPYAFRISRRDSARSGGGCILMSRSSVMAKSGCSRASVLACRELAEGLA